MIYVLSTFDSISFNSGGTGGARDLTYIYYSWIIGEGRARDREETSLFGHYL